MGNERPFISLNGACTNPCNCRSGLCVDGSCIKDDITNARDNAN